jgi:hypothetical protein
MAGTLRPVSSDGCLFCGRSWAEVPKSWEHIWPQWLHGYAGAVPPSKMTRVLGAEFDPDSQEFVEIPLVTVTSQSSLLNLRTRQVCRPCNNGWMSRIEQAAKPSILALADAAEENRKLLLGRSAALNVALWVQKTAVTHELTDERPKVVNTEMGQRLRSGVPLRGALVWAAQHPDDYPLSIAKAHLDISPTPTVRPGDPSKRILLTAITYHYITWRVFITDTPGQMAPPVPIDQWSHIWPLNGSSVEYPPMHKVTGSKLTSMFTDLGRWLPPVRSSGMRRAVS